MARAGVGVTPPIINYKGSFMRRKPNVLRVSAVVATVTVAAACGDGGTATGPSNRSPAASGTMPAQTVTVGETATLTVSSYFRDPDGDALSYGAETSDAAVATVSVSGSTLTVIGVTAGATTVTVTASDPEGLSASQSFEVTAQEPVALAVPAAYLTQAAQDLDSDVPLIAGRQALLRVFGTADDYLTPTGKGLATFFVRGQEVYRAPLEPPTPNIPLDVDESRLDRSFNARIPEHVLQPGLEMVAELDPDRTLPLKQGSRSRFPASGRFAVDVREVPPMHLTFVPVLYHTETEGATATNSQVENAARDLATEDSRGELRYTRDVLPIGDLSVKLREPYYTSANTSGEGSGQILRELSMLRHLEAAEGEYYHGLFAVPEQQHPNWPAGEADPSGHVAISEVFGDFVQRRLIAHELGHNLSLSHAPCGTTGDPAFPYADGSIGIWGHRFIRGDATGFGELFPPEYTDIMSYCFPQWISDYHFSKALRFRSASAVATSRQTAVASTATLLLWGGTHDGDLRLEPAFVLDARVKIPEASGPYDVTGLDDEGRRLFSVSFTPDELDHGGEQLFVRDPVRGRMDRGLGARYADGPRGLHDTGSRHRWAGGADRGPCIRSDTNHCTRLVRWSASGGRAAERSSGDYSRTPEQMRMISRVPPLRFPLVSGVTFWLLNGSRTGSFPGSMRGGHERHRRPLGGLEPRSRVVGVVLLPLDERLHIHRGESCGSRGRSLGSSALNGGC